MSRSKPYKRILEHLMKPKVAVQVGPKVEEMTDTQAYRFVELTEANAGERRPANDNPFEQARYSLEDAAFRLMLGEDEILSRAVSGSIGLYASVAGLEGRWRQLGRPGETLESSTRTLRSGYLALTVASCKELALRGEARVSTFELPELPDPDKLELDGATLQELSAWGKQEKCFCVCEPQRVNRDDIVLMAPLTADSS